MEHGTVVYIILFSLASQTLLGETPSMTLTAWQGDRHAPPQKHHPRHPRCKSSTPTEIDAYTLWLHAQSLHLSRPMALCSKLVAVAALLLLLSRLSLLLLLSRLPLLLLLSRLLLLLLPAGMPFPCTSPAIVLPPSLTFLTAPFSSACVPSNAAA